MMTRIEQQRKQNPTLYDAHGLAHEVIVHQNGHTRHSMDTHATPSSNQTQNPKVSGPRADGGTMTHEEANEIRTILAATQRTLDDVARRARLIRRLLEDAGTPPRVA